eukprot:m51a1_g6786 hypothetical protein (231) ;mRNA; f:168944-169951
MKTGKHVLKIVRALGALNMHCCLMVAAQAQARHDPCENEDHSDFYLMPREGADEVCFAVDSHHGAMETHLRQLPQYFVDRATRQLGYIEAHYEAKVVLPSKPYRDELLRRFLLGTAESKYVSHANGNMLNLRCDNLVILAIHLTQPMECHIFGVPPGWIKTKKQGTLHRITMPNSKTKEHSMSSIIKIKDVTTFLEDRTSFEDRFLSGVPQPVPTCKGPALLEHNTGGTD